jgi:hypothetical protein
MALTNVNSVCAIHGLNGNAFDTWTARNTKMWLRDILPNDEPFTHSRIMTFGYNSTLRDKQSTKTRIEDYANELLQALCLHRTSEQEKARPLILVCHSLGGILARKAIVQLFRHANDYENLKLRQCGLLFLSTPHSGSLQANWGPFISGLGESVGFRSQNIISELQPYSASSVDETKDFQDMKENRPPFYCYCEGNATLAVGKFRYVGDVLDQLQVLY